MKPKAKIFITVAALAAAVGVGIGVKALLTTSTATNASTWAIYTRNSDSTLAQVARQTYANTTAKAQVTTVIKSNRASDSLLIWQINFATTVDTTKPKPPGQTNPGGAASGSFNLKSNTTYKSLTVTGTISGNGVSNIHITLLKITNPAGFGINLYNCTNVTIDSCFFTSVGFGIYAQKCVSIKCNANQILNVNGINTASLGHAIQFNGVTGSGNSISYNRVENIAGVAIHPHDQLNVYESSGLKGDSIMVVGNEIRGGQQSLWPTSNSGAASIVVGDINGNYQVCRNNIVVNPGYIGIQAQGGIHIKVDHNKVFGESSQLMGSGFSWGNYGGSPSSDVTYAYNQATFVRHNGSKLGWNYNGAAPILINNNWDAGLTSSILPVTIITYH